MARPRLVSDEQILEAVRAAVRQGGAGVSLADIAQKVGLSQAALIKRFGTRRALLLAALVPTFQPTWLGKLESGPDDRPLRAQLEDLLLFGAKEIEDAVPRLSALRESGIPQQELLRAMGGKPAVDIALEALTAWFERARDKGLVTTRDLDLESVAAALIGTVHARTHITHLLQRPWTRRSTAEFAKDVARLFSSSLSPES